MGNEPKIEPVFAEKCPKCGLKAVKKANFWVDYGCGSYERNSIVGPTFQQSETCKSFENAKPKEKLCPECGSEATHIGFLYHFKCGSTETLVPGGKTVFYQSRQCIGIKAINKKKEQRSEDICPHTTAVEPIDGLMDGVPQLPELKPWQFLPGIPENPPGDQGFKHDSKKPKWSLLPWKQVGHIVNVLMFGASKYSENNWQKVNPPSRYADAAIRHLIAYMQGEKKDPESGLPHLAHLGCCILFLMWFDDKESENGKEAGPTKGA